MMFNMDKRRVASNLFIVLGLLLVLGAAFSVLWPEYQGQKLRAELMANQPQPIVIEENTPVGDAGGLIIPAPPGSPTLMAATSTPTPQSTATAPAATITAEPTATAMPTVTPTPAATATPTSTPIPPSPPERIVIPDLKLDVKVEEMRWKTVETPDGPQSEWLIPELAAGHAINSAQLGEPGNVVISGHNNIHGRVFRTISEAWGGETEKVDDVTERSHLLDGRKIEMYAADGRRFEYVITEFYRVQDSGVPLAQRIANAKFIQPSQAPQLTVTTCWPPWNNTHRLILIAVPVK